MNKCIRKFKIKDWKNVLKIYNDSFPKNERFPFFLLYFNVLRKNSSIFVLEIDNSIYGFIDLIHYNNMIFILYLAIDTIQRNNGYGSTLLRWCLDKYQDKIIYLNIDEVDNKFDNYKLRKKRLDFYLHNGFYLTDYLSIEKDVNFNILSTNKIFNIKEYSKLDSKISKWYFNYKSNIQKIKL